jgi:hypothetical protein
MEIDPKDFSTDRFVPLSAKIDELQRRVRELEEWAAHVTQWLNNGSKASIPQPAPDVTDYTCTDANCRCTPDR